MAAAETGRAIILKDEKLGSGLLRVLVTNREETMNFRGLQSLDRRG